MDTALPTAARFGSVSLLLRAEGAIELGLAVLTYRHLGGSWSLFAILFLMPDVGMGGYLINVRVGARAYNAAHTYLAPALVAVAASVLAAPSLLSVALIWTAHIGFDRALGYGLKYPTGFGDTHLGCVRRNEQ